MIGKQQPNRAADFNLLATAIIWGSNVVVMKYAIGVLNPFHFNALRFVFSVLALAIWIGVTRPEAFGLKSQKHRKAPLREKSASPELTAEASDSISRRQYVGTIGLYALLFGVVYQVTFLMGIFRTSASSTALIMASVPMWTALIAFFFLKERLAKIAWVGLMVTFLGTVIVAMDKQSIDRNPATLLGNGIMMFCAIAWSASTVISRPVMKYISPVELSFWGMGLALPVHFVIAMLVGDGATEVVWRPLVMLSILYSGIFSTGLALAMWSYGVKILGASHASIYGNLIPLVAMIFGWLMLGEVPTALQWIGGGMIICGLLAMRRG